MNTVPIQTKVSPVTNQFSTQADFSMINTLLANPRYNIPERLRNKVIQSADNVISSEESTDAAKLAASRLVLEADKRNLELIRLVMPKHHVHHNVKDMSTEELVEVIQNAAERFKRTKDDNPDPTRLLPD